MLLPHGYKAGHSARLERYLQLCAEQKATVRVPSTRLGFYMLRRQALRGMRRPLVVMSPKSLVTRWRFPWTNGERHLCRRLAKSTNSIRKPKRGIVLCSGKVYYDLLEQRRKNEQKMSPSHRTSRSSRPRCRKAPPIWCRETRSTGRMVPASTTFVVVPFWGLSALCRPPGLASPAVGYVVTRNSKIWSMTR